MENPHRRLRTAVGLTQAEFAAQAELSRQAVVTLEQGMYDVVPMRANILLARLCREQGIDARGILEDEYGVRSLDQAMNRWKQRVREQVDMSEWPILSLAEIVARFRNPNDFARRLCVPTAALYNATTRPWIAMPDVIPEALRQAGYEYANWVA